MFTRIIRITLSLAISLAMFFGLTWNILVGSKPAATTAAQKPTAPYSTAGAKVAPPVRTVSLDQRTSYGPRPFARPIEVSQRQFGSLTSRGLVLVKFGADWCGPCRKVVPELEKLANDNAGELTVLTVDIDKQRKLADQHEIGSIPRLILFQNGEPIKDWTGFKSSDQLQREINKAKAAVPEGANPKASVPEGEVQANPFAV